MKLLRLLFPLLALLITGCMVPAYTTIINGQSNGYDGTSYDRAVILAVDHQRLPEPALHIGLSAGMHHLLVRVSTRHGTLAAAQETKVAFEAAFTANQEYFVDGWHGGVRLYEGDHMHLVPLVDARVLPKR